MLRVSDGIADESATSENELQQVTVTAQKRAEDIQTVPISITAISGATLTAQGARDLQDVLSEIPNLSFQNSTAPNNMGLSQSRGIAIRGISGTYTTSVYIDDTPVPVSIDPRMLNIDHIEVLMGPQGTLYGQASMGGTVKIVTAGPSLKSVDGFVDADVHDLQGGGAGTSESFSLNDPLSSDSAIKFGGFYSYEPGFLTRTYDDPSAINGNDVTGPAKYVDHVGTQDSYGGFAAYLWQPEGPENLSVESKLMYQDTTSDGWLLTDYSTDDLIVRRALNSPETWQDLYYLATLSVHLDTGIGKLTSATSYFWSDGSDTEDGADVTKLLFHLAYVVPSPAFTNQYLETFAQEFRLESEIGSALRTTTGIYYSDTFNEFREYIIAPGANEASGGVLGTDLGGLEHYPNRSYEWAAFASATYSLTNRLNLTAGLRQSYIQSRDMSWAEGFYVGGPLSTTNLFYKTDSLTPRFSAEYQITDDKMVYTTEAKGFRPGGSYELPDVCDPDLPKLGLPPGIEKYNSDSLWSYEIGSKTRWLDGRLTANIAVYDIEWSNIQEVIELPTCGFPAVINGAHARSQGTELELSWAPTTGISLGLTSGYEDARITAIGPGSGTLYVGQPLNGVAKWTGAANAEFQVPTERLGAAYFRVDYSYVGQSLSLNTSPVVGIIRPSYNLLNVRVGTVINNWQPSLYVKNITNARPNLGDDLSELVALPDRPRFEIGPPRSIGLDVRYKF